MIKKYTIIFLFFTPKLFCAHPDRIIECLEKHTTIHYESFCFICGEAFQNLKRHTILQHSELNEITLKSKTTLSVDHKKELIACPLCHAIITNANRYRHILTIHKKNPHRPFECDFCKPEISSFTTITYLESHIRTVHKKNYPESIAIAEEMSNA